MPEKQLHICHLTVLNPALHSRIFYKEALSMVAAGFRVSIVGQDESLEPFTRQGVQVLPIPVFSPRTWDRVRARRLIWQHAMKAKADIYVVHTPELLGMAKKLKRKFPDARFVYDMHEDYALNIREGGYYPVWLKGALAKRVNHAEKDFATWGDAVVYAEHCFEGKLQPNSGLTFTLPNLFQPPSTDLPELPKEDSALPVMLFSGTVAENWGILRALDLWQRLNQVTPLRLVVAGVVYDESLKERILNRVNENGLKQRFLWWGDGKYVPHPEILAWIKSCDFGVAPYILRPNLKDRIPTRFYEYMAFGKPLVFTSNPAWDEMNRIHNFGIPLEWPSEENEIKQIVSWIGEKRRTQVATEVWNWASQIELNRYHSWLRKS